MATSVEPRRRMPTSGAGDEGLPGEHDGFHSAESQPSESLRGSSDAERVSSSTSTNSSTSTSSQPRNTQDARQTIVRILQIFLPFFLLHFIGKKNYEEGLKEPEPVNFDDYSLSLDNPEAAKEWSFLRDEREPDKPRNSFALPSTKGDKVIDALPMDEAQIEREKKMLPYAMKYLMEPDFDYDVAEDPVPVGQGDEGQVEDRLIADDEYDDDKELDEDDDEYYDEEEEEDDDEGEKDGKPSFANKAPKGAAAYPSNPGTPADLHQQESNDSPDSGSKSKEQSSSKPPAKNSQTKPERPRRTR